MFPPGFGLCGFSLLIVLSFVIGGNGLETWNPPECKEDLASCGEERKDFWGAECLLLKGGSFVSEPCQNAVWSFRKDFTNNEFFYKRLKSVCAEVLPSLEDCGELIKSQSTKPGAALSCVVSKKRDISPKHSDCIKFLKQVEIVVVSDYYLVEKFIEVCEEDVQKTKCGRINESFDRTKNSQQNVIDCLGKHIETLDETCKKEILFVTELQANDYHLDRSLYMACKEDRYKFCSGIKSGDGNIYECLLKHKKEPKLSPNCRKQLTRRQRLVAHDYKASRSLVKYCKEEIRKGKCRKGTSEDKPIRITQILLCLEGIKRETSFSINSLCDEEMKEHRKTLMDDYQMSPELVNKCGKDISNLCDGEVGGHTIHCLMSAATDRKISNSECVEELRLLLDKADIARDWTVDPVLKETCQDAISSTCSNLDGESTVSCLFTALSSGSKIISKECEETLMEIQYFVSRKFSLDPKLYRKCRKDAEKFCDAKEDWHIQDGKGSPLVFSCLARKLYGIADDEESEDYKAEDDLSDDCADQVERVLEQRAVSVKLHPEIEDSCHSYLVNFCVQMTEPGEEMECLQNNLNRINDEDCRRAVMRYTRMEAQNAVLNPVLASACNEVINSECALGSHRKDEGSIIHCLIKLREHDKTALGSKCNAAVEHWQILSLKNWKFSYKFKQACNKDVKEYCFSSEGTRLKTKYDVVSCLSSIMLQDTMKEESHRLSAECRGELKFELLQKHSSIKLNDEVSNKCDKEIVKFCEGVENVLECLKDRQHEKLRHSCVKALFREEQEELLINAVDHALFAQCKHEIKQYCPEDSEPNGVLNCLQEVKNAYNFDPNCRTLVIRRTAEQMKDFRLIPRLRRACMLDIKKFCSEIIGGENYSEGKVVACLEAHFRESKLSPACQRETGNVLRLEASNFNANPELIKYCSDSITQCKASTGYDPSTMEDGGRVEECLMNLFKEGRLSGGKSCQRVVAGLIEDSQIDIHVDPLLHKACALDIVKFCADVPRGRGLQIECLISVFQRTPKFRLERECEKMLSKRMEMYSMALRVIPLDGFNDVYKQLINSPQKNYFFVSICSFIIVCLFIGLCFGRLSKRTAKELKNK